MKIKLDFSEECKANNYTLAMPGTYAIFIRKNCFHRWKQIQSYADIEMALYEFQKLKRAADSMTI